MRRWLFVGIIFVISFLLTWIWLSNAVIGRGYAIWRVKGEYGFVLKNPDLLSRIAQRIRQTGGIMAVAMWVEQGADAGAAYMVSIPSSEQPIVPISGCKVSAILGLLSIVRVQVDVDKVRQTWGEEAEKRLNGMTLLCINHGMTRGNEKVFAAGREAIVQEMQGQLVFGVQ